MSWQSRGVLIPHLIMFLYFMYILMNSMNIMMVVLFLVAQMGVNGYNYSYIPPLLDDSVQLLIQAVNKSFALLCNESCACYNGSVDGSCDNSTSIGHLVSSVLLKTKFEGKSVITQSPVYCNQ